MAILNREDAAKYLGTSETIIDNLTAKGLIDTEWNGAAGEYYYTTEILDKAEYECNYHTYQELSDKLNGVYKTTEAWNLDKKVYECFVTLIRAVSDKVMASNATRIRYRLSDQ